MLWLGESKCVCFPFDVSRFGVETRNGQRSNATRTNLDSPSRAIEPRESASALARHSQPDVQGDLLLATPALPPR